MALVNEASVFTGNKPINLSSPESYRLEERDNLDNHTGVVAKNYVPINTCSSKSGSSGSTVNSDHGFVFRDYYPPQEAHSLINFKNGYDHFLSGNGSLLSFDHNDRVSNPTWEGGLNYNFYWNQINNNNSPRLVEDLNCFESASNFGAIANNNSIEKDQQHHGDWLFSEAVVVSADHEDSESPEAETGLKRPQMGESMQGLKKQCTDGINGSGVVTKKAKVKVASSKDPQSIAAKNRRERISERLKTLQELVPNGTKVDLVTMLEKAISYVKFLQLQVKVLATDEFWPVQGGKAPDISQVKEAIDAILSSQKDST